MDIWPGDALFIPHPIWPWVRSPSLFHIQSKHKNIINYKKSLFMFRLKWQLAQFEVYLKSKVTLTSNLKDIIRI